MATSLLDELRAGTAPSLVPLTIDQLQEMIRTGILHDGDPIELIDGLLVRKDRRACGDNSPHHPRHALLINRLQRLLMSPCASVGLYLRIQLPVRLSSISAAEPDLAVVRGTEENYADRHPGPADLPLVIEVADSSIGTDRSTKQRLYATAGIPHYWVVNLPESQVESYEQPDSQTGSYAVKTIWSRGQTLAWSPSATLRLEIHVGDLFR